MFLANIGKENNVFAVIGKEDNAFCCRWKRIQCFCFRWKRRQCFLLLLEKKTMFIAVVGQFFLLSLGKEDKVFCCCLIKAATFPYLFFTCKVVANLANIVVGIKVLNYYSKKALSSLLILVPELQYPK
jgi:hypothetical protein